MLILLKMIHFLALSVGVGGAAANMIGAPQMRAAEGPAKKPLATAQRWVGQAAAISLVLLWLSGIGLVYAIYGGWGALPAMFWVKFAAVIGLTVVSGTVQYRVLTGLKTGNMPAPPLMAKMAKAGLFFALACVVLAVIAFNGG